MEPGQDEVGAAGDGALERGDGLVAAGEEAEVVVDLDLLRVEPGRLAEQVETFVAMAEVEARHAEPLGGQRVVGGTLEDDAARLLDVREALLPKLR